MLAIYQLKHSLSKDGFLYYVFETYIYLSIYITSVLCDNIFIHVPNVRPITDDSYICTSYRLPPNKEQFIVGFKPRADAKKVHHILLHGCKVPGKFIRDTPNYAWDCNEMTKISSEKNLPDNDEDLLETSPVCVSKMSILFAWALDAPPIELPPEVGFRIGKGSDIDFLVLQVHYGHVHMFKNDKSMRDSSGIELEMVERDDKSAISRSINKLAGIFLLCSLGYVVEGKSEHSIQCPYRGQQTLHPFRFRTHTHKLGTKVEGSLTKMDAFRRRGEKTLIGQRNPQDPQMFYEVQDDSLTISNGDHLEAHCYFDNNRGKIVNIGSTGADEMCNFYIMYWTNSTTLPDEDSCIDYNPSFLI